MKNILDKLKNIHQRHVISFKHLRGKHDQLDHAWNRGMGQGGGGVGLAPNQMGPLPTADFYRKRRIELMNQQRQGLMTRAEMRREMRQLRGVTLDALESNQNDELVLANRRGSPKPLPGQLAFDFSNTEPTTLSSEDKINRSIQQFQEERNQRRLPKGIVVDTRKIPFTKSKGVSGVKKLKTNKIAEPEFPEPVYFYRDTPEYYGSNRFSGNKSNIWSLLRGPLKGLAADSIASAMGLPVAPIAQESSDGFVITNALPIVKGQAMTYIKKLKDKYKKNPTRENYMALRRFLEPLAVMDLIIGQNDGHDGNINIIQNTNRDLYDSEFIMGSVDYDLTGRLEINSTALNEYADVIMQDPNLDSQFLTDEMRQILEQFEKNVKWHESIPEFARQQYSIRVRALLDMNSNYSIRKLSETPSNKYGLSLEPYRNIVSSLSESIDEVITESVNQIEFSNGDKIPLLYRPDIQSVTIETQKILKELNQKINDTRNFATSYWDLTNLDAKATGNDFIDKSIAIRDRLMQAMFDLSNNVNLPEEYNAFQASKVVRNINVIVAEYNNLLRYYDGLAMLNEQYRTITPEAKNKNVTSEMLLDQLNELRDIESSNKDISPGALYRKVSGIINDIITFSKGSDSIGFLINYFDSINIKKTLMRGLARNSVNGYYNANDFMGKAEDFAISYFADVIEEILATI